MFFLLSEIMTKDEVLIKLLIHLTDIELESESNDVFNFCEKIRYLLVNLESKKKEEKQDNQMSLFKIY